MLHWTRLTLVIPAQRRRLRLQNFETRRGFHPNPWLVPKIDSLEWDVSQRCRDLSFAISEKTLASVLCENLYNIG